MPLVMKITCNTDCTALGDGNKLQILIVLPLVMEIACNTDCNALDDEHNANNAKAIRGELSR